MATISVAGDYYTVWTDVFFVIGLVPMLVIGLVGVWLGVLMLRHGFRPRVTPWALILFIPGFFAITEVTSMGSVILPTLWAWAYALHVSVRTEAPARAGGGSRGGGDGGAVGLSRPAGGARVGDAGPGLRVPRVAPGIHRVSATVGRCGGAVGGVARHPW